MNERTLDARGKPCPQPVVETRRILLQEPPAPLRVIVDNDAAGENVTRLARSLGRTVRAERRSGREIHLLIAAPSGGAAESGAWTAAKSAGGIAAARGAEAVAEGAAVDLAAGAAEGEARSVVVLLSGAEFGAGDPQLGALLMRAFVKTMPEVAPLPQAILFINDGVRLTTDGSPLLDDLRGLAERGVRLLSCGTCLDFHRLKDRLAVGEVTNMFEVVSLLTAADRVIRP
ncbi:MAG: sulfurtransferase-like selenium metabolism protein YedF [Candidatus Eisenbacteria bacterium]|uniref:Sulfurtransferase-like selenium metabolism protein YedF n=1 Tax=Eiseniibacteriota bacterium TaxID=2212470 RepID=A0A938BPX0_UNCEI|nr:sulfurtransferase-like selenium metabolism protein YedF [Candidatus Eisenbacteria bacterium]